jgi:hypothetical protein
MTVRFEVHPVNPQERNLNKAAELIAAGVYAGVDVRPLKLVLP